VAREKRFTDTLTELRAGETQDELTAHLRDLVLRVRETGRPGSITLTLKVKNASKGAGVALIIQDDIKVKLPVSEKGDTFLFADADGQLQRHDPRQPRLAELDGPRVTPLTVGERTEAKG